MSLVERILGRAAANTVLQIGKQFVRDQKKYQEGFDAGYRQGYADAKAGKKPKVKP